MIVFSGCNCYKTILSNVFYTLLSIISKEMKQLNLPQEKTFRSKSNQTEQQDYIRAITFTNVAGLLKTRDTNITIGQIQNQQMADDFEYSSSVPFPESNKISDFICLPPDVMAYEVKDNNGLTRLSYSCPEINGTGFAGIRYLPKNQYTTVMNTYTAAAAVVKKECKMNNEIPLMIVASSGREGAHLIKGEYDSSANSNSIWEKAFIADRCAEALGDFFDPCYAESLDKVAIPYLKQVSVARVNLKQGIISKDEYFNKIDEAENVAVKMMEKNKNRPMVLLGYSRDLVECCTINDGRPYLFGRVVNCIINDRAALNLIKKENKVINNKKVYLMNVNVEEGANKLASSSARDEFHYSEDARSLPHLARERGFSYDVSGLDNLHHFARGDDEDLTVTEGMTPNELEAHRMTYYRGVTEEEGIDGILTALDEFRSLHLNPLFKPTGTGQSLGIIGYQSGELREDFKQRFFENLNVIEKLFGKGAGYPFLVMPILQLAKTNQNQLFDFRFTVYQKIDDKGKSTIHTIPLNIKKAPVRSEEERRNENQFQPTNVTLSVEKSGMSRVDFVEPLCCENGLNLVGLSVDQVKSMCLYFSTLQSWLLKTKYSR